jgi:hypothetical protein
VDNNISLTASYWMHSRQVSSLSVLTDSPSCCILCLTNQGYVSGYYVVVLGGKVRTANGKNKK